MKNLNSFELSAISGGNDGDSLRVTNIGSDISKCRNEASDCINLAKGNFAPTYQSSSFLNAVGNVVHDIMNCLAEESACIARACGE
jgi:hypothetical protein